MRNTSYLLEYLFSKGQELTSVGENVEKRELIMVGDGCVNELDFGNFTMLYTYVCVYI